MNDSYIVRILTLSYTPVGIHLKRNIFQYASILIFLAHRSPKQYSNNFLDTRRPINAQKCFFLYILFYVPVKVSQDGIQGPCFRLLAKTN